MKVEISVIIPFYNNFNLMKKAINSVLNQTYKKYEIIIIYDNPKIKDNLINLKKFINKKSKIKLLINKTNIGAGYSRNKGIKLAQGKFIAFLDSDDVWKKNKLSFQRNYMKKNKLMVSHTSYDIIDINNKFIKKRVAENLSYSDLINSCDVGLSTVMINRKILVKNILFAGLRTKEDYILWLKIAKKGIIFYALKKTLTKWTRTPNSLSTSVFQKFKDAFTVYNKYEGYNFINTLIRVTILSMNFLIKK